MKTQILNGTVTTPTLRSQVAVEAMYQVPTGTVTRCDINRAREALANIQGRATGCAPLQAERIGLAGDAGKEFKAIWVALNKAFTDAIPTSEDSSLRAWSGE